MKLVFYVLTLVISALCQAGIDDSYSQAILHGALAKILFRVVDDEGSPVSKASAHIWFSSYARHQDDADWVVDTDTNGIFIASHRTNEELSWLIQKDGYYQTHGNIRFRERKMDEQRVVDGKWQPYGETKTVTLRRIKNAGKLRVFPKSMEMREKRIPVFGKWVAFDLESYDWTSPYGQGLHEDVMLRFTKRVTNKLFDFRLEMDVSFTNNFKAGVYERKKKATSDFQWDYMADTNALFNSTLSFVNEAVPGEKGESKCLDGNAYYVYRTRTTADGEGHLISAHYGVISGKWTMGSVNMIMEDSCFNPVENDANIEDGLTVRDKIRNYKRK